MEQYLIEQYQVFEDSKYLTSADDIEDFFKDNGVDLFECGQGYYQDEVNLICKIGDKFYQVDISADIVSAKQDVGDRLYWVDNIENVTYSEIDKPKPKDVTSVTYELKLTDVQRSQLESYLDDRGIKYE